MGEGRMIPASTARSGLVEAARVLSGLGLVTAYGHVSVRTGTSMLITPAADLATVTESAVLDVPLNAPSLPAGAPARSEEHTSELQSRDKLVCRLLLEKKKKDLSSSACGQSSIGPLTMPATPYAI